MKRAQIEFGESLMVVVVLVFLLVIGIVFYYHFAKSSIKSELANREDISSVTLGKRVLALPEIRCGDYDGGDTCIDELKLVSLSGLLNKSDTTPTSHFNAQAWGYYSQIFEYSTITIDVVEPPREFTLYSDVPPGKKSSQQQYIFTTIYDPVGFKRTIAYLNVTRYTLEVG